MSEAGYDIVFLGEIVEGFDRDEVKASFARIFHLSQEKLAQLFSHPRVILQRNLPQDAAERYRTLLRKAGVEVLVQASTMAREVPARGPATVAAPVPSAPERQRRDGGPPPDAPAPASGDGPGLMPFEFTGRGGEYFKIWIVNILLTILTLGIYSAWAKVRTKRYFYGNTRLDGAAFEYLANPVAILKGRLIAFALFAAYALANNFLPLLAAILSFALMPLIPWLVVRSLAFRAYNSAYRNVRFGFTGTYGGAAKAFLLWPLLGALTLGLLAPWAFYRQNRFRIENSRYGTTGFSFDAPVRDYYVAFLGVVGLVVVGFGISALMLFLGIAPPLVGPVVTVAAYLLAFAYFTVKINNVNYNHTLLAEHGLAAEYELRSYALLLLTNTLGVALTLGLFYPWAKVRNARYAAAHMQLLPAGSLEHFSAAEQGEVSAAGLEIGEVFSFDFGL